MARRCDRFERVGLAGDTFAVLERPIGRISKVMRGVEARIRDLSWSLLITFLREDERSGVTLPEDGPVAARSWVRWVWASMKPGQSVTSPRSIIDARQNSATG